MEISIGMTREGLRRLAAEIVTQCDLHSEDEGIEITRRIEHNDGTDPGLTLVLGNTDMEGDHVMSPDTALWEQF